MIDTPPEAKRGRTIPGLARSVAVAVILFLVPFALVIGEEKGDRSQGWVIKCVAPEIETKAALREIDDKDQRL